MLAPFLAAQADAMAAQLTAAIAHVTGTAAKADAIDPDIVGRILHLIDFDDWAALPDDVERLLVEILLAGQDAAFLQIAVTPLPAMTAQAHALAVAWAEARAAELVGMRRLATGTLVPNPDAQWAITASTRDMLRGDVVRALEEGWSNDTLAAALKDGYAFSAARADTIARTETARADVAGSVQAYAASGEVSGKRWMLGSEHEADGIVDECDTAARMGVVALDSDFGGIGDPPAHPKCFLPGTIVSAAGVTAHFARWFEGEVVVLRVAGVDLACTRNHPILTPRGWIAAGALQAGDHVFQCSDPAAAISAIDPDDHHVESRIEEIAGALRMAGRVCAVAMPTTAEDFHGDGVVDGQVDVVLPARALEADAAEAIEDRTHLTLGIGHGGGRGLAPERSGEEPRDGRGLPADGGVRSLSASRALHGPDSREMNGQGVALRSHGESVTLEHLAERGAVTAEAITQLHSALAGLIHPVEISEVRQIQYAGHVYNVETLGHWYLAGNIIVHNCKCDVFPVPAED